MAPSSYDERTTITRLRIRCPGQDPLATQLRIAHGLSSASVRPPELAPTAILCVRRLYGHAPTTCAAWERPLAAALARMARQAARPAFGPVPANAEAVLFSDRAELLACLAEEWLAGGDPTHWWWPTLFKQRDLTQALLRAWLDAPEYAPAALEQLAAKGQAHRFARAMPQSSAASLLEGIVTCFGLRNVGRALYAPVAPSETQGRLHPFSVERSAPPWQGLVVEVSTGGLSPHQHALLAVALMVSRGPALLRSDAFAEATMHWWQHAHAQMDDSPLASDLAPAEMFAATANRPMPPALSDAANQEPDAEHPSPGLGPTLPTTEQAAALPPAVDAPGQMLTALHEQPHHEELLSQVVVESPMQESETESAPSLPRPTTLEATPLPATLRAPTTKIETAYGGLFYLINLGIYLELYADFTSPLATGIALDIYDFVALMGEVWFGGTVRGDPVWALLAELAGREPDDPPGQEFTPPDHQPLAVWLDALLTRIDVALRTALDLPEDALSLPAFLCMYKAQVAVSATHLDIYLALTGLPIEIRMSGLDRNPGWVPAAGRYVTFYFE